MAPAPLRVREGVIPLLRIGGISVVADPSWFLQLLLLTVVARVVLVGAILHDPGSFLGWMTALGLALAIVACIVVHEFAHSIIARLYGLPVRRIVLFLFGGVSQIEREAPTPRAEYAVAIAGPMASVMLATMLAGVARLLNPTAMDVRGVWGWFAYINLVLAIFNLLPAFPMDGGRLLRSLMWAWSHNRTRATRWAALAGRGFAVAMATLGVVAVLSAMVSSQPGGGQGIYLVALGWFLYTAAGNAERMEGGARPNQHGDRPDDAPVEHDRR